MQAIYHGSYGETSLTHGRVEGTGTTIILGAQEKISSISGFTMPYFGVLNSVILKSDLNKTYGPFGGASTGQQFSLVGPVLGFFGFEGYPDIDFSPPRIGQTLLTLGYWTDASLFVGSENRAKTALIGSLFDKNGTSIYNVPWDDLGNYTGTHHYKRRAHHLSYLVLRILPFAGIIYRAGMRVWGGGGEACLPWPVMLKM